MIEWNVSPEIFQLGGFAPRWYGVLFATSFYLAYRYVLWVFEREKLGTENVDRLLLLMMGGTIAGARLGHTLFYEPDVYLRDPIRILFVWEGGLASHGALLGVLAGLLWFRRQFKALTLIELFDRLCVAVALQGCLIRLGNLFNSEIVGKPTDAPWAFRFMRLDGVPRHPTQLYEAVCYLAIFFLLQRVYVKTRITQARGTLFGMFLVLVFGARFGIEFFKEHQVEFEARLPLDLGQLLSLPLIALGLFLIARGMRSARRSGIRPFAASAVLVMSVALGGITSPPAHARWATADEAEFETEFQHARFDVRKDGSFDLEIEERTRILKEGARTSKGIVTLTYNARAESLKVLEAYTLNGKQKTSVDLAMIEDKPLASRPEGFDQTNQVLIAFPDVRVGSSVHLKYREQRREVPFEGFFAQSFTFGWFARELKSTAEIRSELPLVFRKNDPTQALEVRSTREGGRTIVRVVQKKPIQRTPVEEDSAYLDPALVPWVTVSTTDRWTDMARPVLAAHEQILNAALPPVLKKIASEARLKPTLEAKLNHVTSRLSEEMRYLGDWRPIRGGHVPRRLDAIVASRFGDCKDLSALTAATLRALGISARMAWIYRSVSPVGTSYALPLDALFNHAIVHVEADGREFWLDPTNLASFAEGVFEDLIDRPALVLYPDRAELKRTPAAAPEGSRVTLRMTKDLRSDDEVRARAELRLEGRQTLEVTGSALSASPQSIKYALVRAASGGDRLISWKVADFDLTSRIARDLDLRLEYREKAYEMRTSAGRGYLVDPPNPVSQFLVNTEGRVSDLLLVAPYLTRKELRLPGITRVGEENLDCRIDSPWLYVSREVRTESDGITVEDRMTLKTQRVRASELRSPDFLALQDRVRKCFGSVALVYRVK